MVSATGSSAKEKTFTSLFKEAREFLVAEMHPVQLPMMVAKFAEALASSVSLPGKLSMFRILVAVKIVAHETKPATYGKT
jgi:hypothetical protein